MRAEKDAARLEEFNIGCKPEDRDDVSFQSWEQEDLVDVSFQSWEQEDLDDVSFQSWEDEDLDDTSLEKDQEEGQSQYTDHPDDTDDSFDEEDEENEARYWEEDVNEEKRIPEYLNEIWDEPKLIEVEDAPSVGSLAHFLLLSLFAHYNLSIFYIIEINIFNFCIFFCF